MIELRFFGGLSVEETATVLEVSARDRHARLEVGEGVADAGAARRRISYFVNAASQLRTTVMGDAVAASTVTFIRKRPSAQLRIVPSTPSGGVDVRAGGECVSKSATAVPASSSAVRSERDRHRHQAAVGPRHRTILSRQASTVAGSRPPSSPAPAT